MWLCDSRAGMRRRPRFPVAPRRRTRSLVDMVDAKTSEGWGSGWNLGRAPNLGRDEGDAIFEASMKLLYSWICEMTFGIR